MLHKESVEAETLDLIRTLLADEQLSNFNLVGGTALALMIGHRKSIDIDLFTNQRFNATALAKHLSDSYTVNRLNQAGNNIWCIINGVKVDPITHQYPNLKPPETIEGIRMLSMEDIAAMKMHAIFQDGSRLKDFVDMHFLLEKIPLEAIMKSFVAKYPHVNASLAHRGLLFHKDVNFLNKVDFLGRTIPFPEIDERLKYAVQFPARIFKTDLAKVNLKDDSLQVPRNQKKRGRKM